MQLFLLVSLAISVTAVVFALQNATMLTLHFLNWQFEGSLALILLGAMAVGILMSFMASIPAIFKRSRKISQLKKEVKELKKTIEEKEMADPVFPPDSPPVKNPAPPKSDESLPEEKAPSV